LAVAARYEMRPLLEGKSNFPFLLLAVTIAAWYGGLGPGIFATALGALLASFFIIEPVLTFILTATDWISLALFTGTGIAVSMIAGEANRELDRRKKLANELEEAMTRENLARSEAEAARDGAQAANRAKDDFLAMMSHELRTPLNAILGWTQLMRTDLGPLERKRAIDTVERCARNQAKLVDDLLDISRIINGKSHVESDHVDLVSVTRSALDTVRTAAEAKSINLRMAIGPGNCMAVGDAMRLQQVVWNLLSNSIKFTPANGNINVRLTCRAPFAEITVSDTGRGIDPELLPFVFEKFRQDGSSSPKQGGLGLGLAIVRHIVEIHGGTVDAANNPDGIGCTIRIRLPLLQRGHPESHESDEMSMEDPSEETRPSPSDIRGLRILVVDDNLEVRVVLKLLLTSRGARVKDCESATEAFALFTEWQPDIVVSDIAMPGEDGYWLINKIRQLPPTSGGDVPALAVSALSQPEDKMRSLSFGFDEHLTKPVDTSELVDAIIKHTRRG
jgi:signal transduction histidine kinase